MQRSAKSDLTLILFSSLKDSQKFSTEFVYRRLYQQIASRVAGSVAESQKFREVGESLLALADDAYGRRRMDVVAEVSHLLENLPLPAEYRSGGRYYQALHLIRQRQSEPAGTILESVIEGSSSRYRSRALMSLGGVSFQEGKYGSAITYFVEAARLASNRVGEDLCAFAGAQRALAMFKSLEGNHQRAVADLERLFPAAQSIARWQPHVYYDYLNSLAVEYAAVGRIEEARNASRIALASPYASAYPEWRETFDDIEQKRRPASRSLVATSQNRSEAQTSYETTNVVQLTSFPRAQNLSSGLFARSDEPARIIDFRRWSRAHPMSTAADNKLRRLTAEQLNTLTRDQKRARLIKLIYGFQPDDEKLNSILARVEAILFDLQSPA